METYNDVIIKNKLNLAAEGACVTIGYRQSAKKEDEYEDISDRLSKNWKLKRIKICFGEVFPEGDRSGGITADGSRAPEAALDFSEKRRD